MKGEKLSSYGKAFDHMPLKAQILQMKVMFSELNRKFGLLRTVGFIRHVYRKQNQLKTLYGDTVNERFADVPSSAIMDMYLMSSMYLVLADREALGA